MVYSVNKPAPYAAALEKKNLTTTYLVVTAIRVQDVTNHKWFNWDNGTWDSAGAPKIAAGNQIYIAAWAVNKSVANGCHIAVIVNGVQKATGYNVLGPEEGFGIEWNGTQTSPMSVCAIRTQMDVHIAEEQPFTIAGADTPPNTCPTGYHWDATQNSCILDASPPPPPFGDNTLLIVGGIGAVLIIAGVAAYVLKRKKQS